jgi:ribose transport system permease protein
MSKWTSHMGFDRFSGLYIWGVFIVVFGLLQPSLFFSSSTMYSIAANKAVLALVALAILVPLVTGVYDLAVGATVNFVTITVVLLIKAEWNMWAAIAVGILSGTVIGFVNGFVVVKLRVNSFIATLGMASVIAATQVIITSNEQPLPPTMKAWSQLTQTKVFGFQIVFLYMLIIAFILWWFLTYTPAGRYMFAIGSSPDAARLTGIKVDYYTWLSLVISGTVAGIAGVLYGSLTGPSLSFGGGLLLPAFAAVFLGSTQIKPGRFNVWGTVLAIYVLATGVRGLQLMTDVQWLDQMFSGLALIGAVAVAVGRQRSADERKRKAMNASVFSPPDKKTLDAVEKFDEHPHIAQESRLHLSEDK